MCKKELKSGHLGWANSWSEDPPIVKKCKELGHGIQVVVEHDLKRSDHIVTCRKCGYWYYYDSS